jgi:hypothetical protein
MTTPSRPRLLPLESRLTPAFTPTAPVSAVAPDPLRLVAGRFDGNSFADIAVLDRPTESTPQVPVKLGTGDGGFVAGSILTGPPLNASSDAVTGDFNRDGNADLVIASEFGQPGVLLYLGNGDGSFQAPTTVSNNSAEAITTGDFTGDGFADLVTLGFTPGRGQVFTVYAGNGAGGFTPWFVSSSTAASDRRRLATTDLDGNGLLDLVTIDPFQNRLVVRYGAGNGSFGDDVYTPLSNSPQDFALTDFVPDAAGRPELVIVEGGNVVLRRNLGNGTFDPVGVTLAVVPGVTGSSGIDSTRIAAADFDGDGAADLVFVDRGLDTATVLTNTGTGAFTPDPRNRSYSVFGGASDVVIADVDGDANPDFVTLSRGTQFGDVVRAFVSDAADATVTTLSVSASPIVFGQSVTLTATVRPVIASEGVPQGTVTFRNGTEVLGEVALTNGVAQLTLPFLPAGTYSLTAEYAGFTPPPPTPATRLGGYVYDDANDDGVKQPFEDGIAGTTVTLYRDENGQSVVVDRVTTGDNGYYEFSDLPVGTYAVVEEQPVGYAPGRNTIGTVNGNPGSGFVDANSFQQVSLATGDVGQNYNFGERVPGVLSGFVYADVNENGVRNPGTDPGITGVTVRLLQVVGSVTTFLAAADTDANGFYQFTGLTPGAGYRIEELQPTQYANGAVNVGTGGGTAGVNAIGGVTVTAGGSAMSNNFGELYGRISGFVYEDFGSGTTAFNNNGVFNVGEDGIAGATVTLVRVVGTTTTTIGVTTTNAAGAYQFDQLLLGGGYRVIETQPAVYDDGQDTPGVPGGGTVTANDVISGINLTDPNRVSPNNNFGEQPSPPPPVLNAPPPTASGPPPVAFLLPGVPSRFRSSSDTVTLVVNRAATASALSVTAANVPTGRPLPVTVQAVGNDTVPPPFPPGGVVNIFNGTTLIGTGTLDANGRATIVIPNRPAGRLSLTAAYAGTTNFLPSVSPAIPGPNDPNFLPLFVVGSDNGAVVCVYEADGTLSHGVSSFGAEFLGVRPTLADLTGDEFPDIIVGSGPGNRSRVAVADGRTRALVTATVPFEEGFVGGVTVAAADLDGDGRAEVIVGADDTGGPRIRVYRFRNGVLEPVADFFAFEEHFRGGVRLAAADVNRDGVPDVIAGAGPRGGPRVAVFDGAALAAGRAVRIGNDFFAYELWFDGGVYVAAADVNGDGYAEIILGAGARGGPRVVAFDGLTHTTGGHRMVVDFYARAATDTGGVRVSARDLDGDGLAEILVGAGVKNGARVRVFDGKAVQMRFDPIIDVDAFPGLTAGVYVG